MSNGNATPNGNGENIQIQAKVSYVPMIVTTMIGTAAAVVTTIFITRYFDKKKEESELVKEREREEMSMMNPAMPMMWPGMVSQQPNPAANANANAGASPSQLAQLTDRLEAWENNIAQREQTVDAREQQLRLVMGGGE
jgi:hypothetical protein